MAMLLLPFWLADRLATLASLVTPPKATVYAAVEGGGTSWRAAIAVGRPDNIVERTTFKTEKPEVTLVAIRKWLDARKYDSLGIGTFGPIQPDRSHPQYGCITSTPKPFWKNAKVVQTLCPSGIPHLFDTDVNAPAYAEFLALHATNPGLTSLAYITVGTGVGIGLVINGQPVHGLLHPEGGHMLIRRQPGETFAGVCPFHKDCVEGLVSAPALAARRGVSQEELANLDDDDFIWDAAADALANACANLLLTVSPQAIVISGGVMLRACLFDKVRARTLELLAGYVDVEQLLQRPEEVIRPSTWGNNAGIMGALHLSKTALERS
ncbi:uncharacterized protein MONBRDRAFT_33963 [Monosiga brevicollis MX1]|uniref:fructokinase n=1 Tax=Monosiga brevicollis TaxID=81824 RepID=A9V8S7_MONBE|nr:uncharacterized protein MONBRDRAFT_33963 [Monosiga brevicollis MX1]EDQ85925.1 predicted protein [Monosiga brevicollis MX1]|eukprot:XP_001749119.1 hypothetical protein [Monosiga brevicollis MX1]